MKNSAQVEKILNISRRCVNRWAERLKLKKFGEGKTSSYIFSDKDIEKIREKIGKKEVK